MPNESQSDNQEGKSEYHFWLGSLKFLGYIKHLGLGILVVLSFIGAIYGSFGPEKEARLGFKTLKPHIQENEADIANIYLKLAYIEGRLANGKCPSISDTEMTPVPEADSDTEAPEETPKEKVPAPTNQQGAPKPRRRHVIEAPWEQKMPTEKY